MSILVEEDKLCVKCRRKLKMERKIIDIRGLKVETFYEYDGLFRSLLIQMKECYDEALKDVFLYGLEDYIRWKYRGYSILYVPSTKKKIEERGFEHLKLIYGRLGLSEVKGLKLKREIVQEGKNREKREEMIYNYVYTGGPRPKVLIVDDVVTTGSSIYGIYNTMLPHATQIKAIALARVPPKENAFKRV